MPCFFSDEVGEVLTQIKLENAVATGVAHKLGFKAGATLIAPNDAPLVQWLLRKPAPDY